MKAIEVEAGQGQSIYVQINPDVVFETPKAAADDAGGAEGVLEPRVLLAKLDDISDTISATCKSLQRKIITGLKGSWPSEMSIEFGVTLGGEAGIPFVTNGSVETAFKVTATWTFDVNHQTN
jgi:hypothetical protein